MNVRDSITRYLIIKDSDEEKYRFSPNNVYQEGFAKNRERLGQIIDKFTYPQSRIDNVEYLAELYNRCQKGETCLILGEHYSNMDFPSFFRMVEKQLGQKIAESILPIRGLKLSEESSDVATPTRAYDTIIIYPSRSLDSITDPKELEETRKISVPINHAAMREMIKRKKNGRIILVFPAGTRYRSWDPESRKGVREIHSYIKTFDNMVFIACNGNILPPIKNEEMALEELQKDLLIYTCSPIVKCSDFKKQAEANTPSGQDKKSFVVDSIMAKLFEMHDKVEPARLREKKTGS